jgi:hypothetical protein
VESKFSGLTGALAAGGVAAGARLVAWGALALAAALAPEAHMLTLLDVPTLAVYWFVSQLGTGLHVKDAYDVGFALSGMLTWFVLGMCSFAIYDLTRRRNTRVGKAQ